MAFKIGTKTIGDNHPVFIIAEMSCNHLQNYEYAVEIIKKAKEAGADAIKLQTYTPDTMTIDYHNEYFSLKGTIWEDKTPSPHRFSQWHWVQES
jgi:pseudaminic acid synthase